MTDSTTSEDDKDTDKQSPSTSSNSSKQTTITGVQPEKPSDIPKNAR